MKGSDASAKTFTRPTYSISRKGGKSVLVVKKTFWKNNVKFVEDLPMIYVNFIITVIRDSEKKLEEISFLPLLV